MIALLLAARIVAATLSGECGPLDRPCELLVASTMQTRLEAGSYGDTLVAVVADGYYGRAPATAAASAVAWALVTGRVHSMGFEWAYSQTDLERMGWRRGDLELERNGLVLHLARTAPWEETHGD